MDVPVPAPAPLVVGSRWRLGAGPAEGFPESPPRLRPAFLDDDLPGFFHAPPGTAAGTSGSPSAAGGPEPGSALPDVPSDDPDELPHPDADPVAVAPGPHPDVDPLGDEPLVPGRRRARALAGSALGILLLGGVAAAVLAPGDSPGVGGSAAATSSAPSAAPSGARPSPPTAGPAPAAVPAPGDPGAGALASTDVPLGPGVVGARMAFTGVSVTRVPAGVTATFPTVGLTSSGDRTLVHLQLPMANCLTPAAPATLEGSGCLLAGTEFADLSTPELTISRDGAHATVSGRFPTYLRPDGAAPVWTGRAYDLTIAVQLPEPAGDAPVTADGSIRIGDQTSPARRDPGLSTVRYGR